MINIAGNDIVDMAVGSTPIEKAYIGSQLVWEKALSAKDYIQNGLVAMWDGIENIGWGQHSDSSTVWVDLMGTTNYNFTLQNNATWESDGLVTNSDYARAAETVSSIPYASNLTTEIVLKIYAVPSSYTRLIFCKLGDTVNVSGLNILMRIFGYNKKRNINGWMLKSGSVMKGTSISRNTPLSFAIVYAVPSGNASQISTQNPSRILINNTSQSPNWGSDGSASNITNMYISVNATAGFYGKVYAIRVYNRQLSNTEIGQNYLVDKKRFGI